MENYFETKLDYIRVGHWEASSTSLKMNSKENGVGIKWIYVYLKSMRWISSKDSEFEFGNEYICQNLNLKMQCDSLFRVRIKFCFPQSLKELNLN